MANRIFRSLFWFLFSFALTVWSGLAFAEAPIKQFAAGTSGWHDSLDTPCQVWATIGLKNNTEYWKEPANGYLGRQTRCAGNFKPATAQFDTITSSYGPKDPLHDYDPFTWTTSSRMWCRSNDKPDTTKPLDKQCPDAPPPGDPPPNCTDKNPFIRTWIYGPKGPYSPPTNFGGCKVIPEEMKVCRKVSSTVTHCMWQVRRDGNPFEGEQNPNNGSTGSDIADKPELPPVKSPPITNTDKTPENTPCPAGTVHAGADSSGIPMCIGMGTDPKQAPPTTPPKTETSKPETQADGSTKTTTTTTTTNSDGSTTTHTTTTIVKTDGTKEVVQSNPVTSQTPTGGDGKQDKPEEQSDLCKLNPMLTICRNSSVTGSCGQISCQGDAIQCATLRAAAAMECKQRTDAEELKASSMHSLGAAAIAGTDPMQAKLPTPANGSVVDVGGLSADGWLGAGAAFSDVSFSLLGQTVVIPLAKISGYLVGLRYALMVVASLVSFRILSGAILRE